MREKLIELLADSEYMSYEKKADHLIANGVTVQKWIPVSERLPEKIDKYLVLSERKMGSGYIPYLAWYKPKSGGFYIYDSDFGDVKLNAVTHWMPLPEPPKEVSHTF